MSDNGFTDEGTGDQGGFDDALEFRASARGEVTEKDQESTGGARGVDQEGRYHCIVSNPAKFDKPVPLDHPQPGKPPLSAPSMQITLKVLAGDHPDQKDRAIYHRLYLWEWSDSQGKYVLKEGKKLKFPLQICNAIDAGSYDPETDEISFNFKGIEHRQCVVEIRNDPYDENKGKKGPDGQPLPESMKDSFKIPFGNAWKPDAKCVEDVPKDADYMAMYIAGKQGGDDDVKLF